ncbi:transcriptional regulator, TetR family [Micromonospora pattaloongensis]|uniref:Transcriptional regulator, TetR family n=1 Tax=Micromonospora pattaloongensis TaxID=405436 RepID=A0A1H3R4E7_9ACTN|nr:TetR/AcrR family transcriptional regulator [Micromonospora pattaloongensis]SDZ20383.1 transcriptional regulator, TetR family [Micromonospora pattaloongensis]
MSNAGELPSLLNASRPSVPSDLVDAALHAAERLGKDVADVPVLAIAQEAGISRSTLLRRLGGSRQALDEAVRAAGVDPGGQRPVRERAIDAGAHLIGEHGLASLTLESVAAAAHCSVHSLYSAFGGRDELLFAIFERYSPILDAEKVLSGPHADLADTVRTLYRLLAEALSRQPRVMPAMLAEVLARPAESALQNLARHVVPRLLAGVGQWLADEVAAGRIRAMPIPLLMHQMVGPLLMHFLTRPALHSVPGVELPGVEETCEAFAEAFLHAVALPQPPHARGHGGAPSE